MKHQIKHRYTGSVLFECEVPDDVQASGLATRYALEQAVQAGANLEGAYLARANLNGADLARANLNGANLAWAYLARANLDGAYLARANLDGAYLARANLDGAKLGEKTLVGERPVLMIGPIGSRSDYFTAYLTDAGVVLSTGCFVGTVDEFTAQLSEEHGDNIHAKEYRAALDLIQCHTGLWTPPTV